MVAVCLTPIGARMESLQIEITKLCLLVIHLFFFVHVFLSLSSEEHPTSALSTLQKGYVLRAKCSVVGATCYAST